MLPSEASQDTPMPSVDVDRVKNEPQRSGADRPGDWPRPEKGATKINRPPLNAEQQRLVERNMGLAYKLARHFGKEMPGLTPDIESSALIGLCEAAQTWKEVRGVPFGAYARCRIIGTIKDFLMVERKGGITDVSAAPEHEPIHEHPDLVARERAAESEEDVEQKYDTAGFESMIADLSDEQREVCRSIFVDGLSQRDTARLRGTSKTKVFKTIAAAVRTIREAKAG